MKTGYNSMAENSIIRGAGILMPITSLPSNYGIGTLGREAYAFVDLLVNAGQKYWQVLPLGHTSYGDSPYQAVSAFAGNPYMIDLDILIEEGLVTREEVEESIWESEKNRVDYGLVYMGRFPILHKAYGRFDSGMESYLSFCEEKKEWLDDYAFFMALKDYFDGSAWTSWAKAIRDRAKKSMEVYRESLKEEIDFWKFCQYKFFEQWNRLHAYANEKGIQIIGDIPLYPALDSADVWANRDEFLLNETGYPAVVAGCPPDAFSDFGQKWGNPIYDWKKMEQDDFSWWRKRMKANANLYDIIRIDHFIGVVKYYSIPAEDEDARNGNWNEGPGKKLTDMIEETVGKGRIIAEDLGVSVPEVKELLKETGWPGMKILLFAFDGNTAHEYLPHNYEDRNIAVYPGTHDNDTVAGFFAEKTEEELDFLCRYLQTDRAGISEAVIRLAYSSIADLVVVQMQDILKLGNEARMNLPSTMGQNWRWRFAKEELSEQRVWWLRELAYLYRR